MVRIAANEFILFDCCYTKDIRKRNNNGWVYPFRFTEYKIIAPSQEGYVICGKSPVIVFTDVYHYIYPLCEEHALVCLNTIKDMPTYPWKQSLIEALDFYYNNRDNMVFQDV